MKKFKGIRLIFVFFEKFVIFFENSKKKKVQVLWSLTFHGITMKKLSMVPWKLYNSYFKCFLVYHTANGIIFRANMVMPGISLFSFWYINNGYPYNRNNVGPMHKMQSLQSTIKKRLKFFLLMSIFLLTKDQTWFT